MFVDIDLQKSIHCKAQSQFFSCNFSTLVIKISSDIVIILFSTLKDFISVTCDLGFCEKVRQRKLYKYGVMSITSILHLTEKSLSII